MTGQESFAAMIRDVLAPALRAAGFRGSGQRNAVDPVGVTIRIGALLPGGQDRWWTVRGGADPTRVGEEVAAAIRGPGVAWLRSERGTPNPRPADQTS